MPALTIVVSAEHTAGTVLPEGIAPFQLRDQVPLGSLGRRE
eukprot:COSAG01_NODE_2403_length_7757_cov_4.745887_8_plen_41_part_00